MSRFSDIFSGSLRELFFGQKYKNCFSFVLILVPNSIAALLEGASFGMILLAFSVLNGENFEKFASYPFLSLAKGYSSNHLFILFSLLAIIFQSIRSGMSYLGQLATTNLSLKIQVDAQSKVYKQILRLSFPCVSRYKVGELVEYARTPSLFISGFMDAINRFIVSFFMIAISLILMFCMSGVLTLIAGGVFAFFSLGQKIILKKLTHSSTRLCDHLEEFSKQTVQSIYGIRVIHTYNRQEGVYREILGTLGKISQYSKRLNLWSNSIISINEIIGVLLAGTILLLGSILLQSPGSSALPILMTFITVSYRLSSRVQATITALGGIASSMGYILKLRDILSDQDKEYTPSGGVQFTKLQNCIEFQNVSLRYQSNLPEAIKGFSCTIPRGSVVALVGASGAGKSSAMDLLLRLYEPTSGDILIDGVPLRNYEIGSWRKILGVVSQDTFVFNETIEENIRFGLVEASQEQIMEAAKMAGAHEFIDRLPHQYQTLVGERGYRLSGGERQRLALARALLRDPEILILDEATSNLDSHSEHLIQVALEKFQQQRTVIIVAHRLSTIVKADQIIVMKQGELMERGSHEELVGKDALYASFWKLQTKTVREEETLAVRN